MIDDWVMYRTYSELRTFAYLHKQQIVGIQIATKNGLLQGL